MNTLVSDQSSPMIYTNRFCVAMLAVFATYNLSEAALTVVSSMGDAITMESPDGNTLQPGAFERHLSSWPNTSDTQPRARINLQQLDNFPLNIQFDSSKITLSRHSGSTNSSKLVVAAYTGNALGGPWALVWSQFVE